MIKWLFLIGFFPMALVADGQGKTSRPGKRNPNIILIFCDDLGYGDLACYGAKKQKTPNLDQMAADGIRYTDFYVTSGVCTPSRSSLMTGCYPRRVDLHVNAKPRGSVGRQVLFPVDQKGLNPDELTVAEILKSKGYATACIGKWHLGDQDPFLPTRQGFGYYFGIPYSNDMNRPYCPLPLMKDEKVIEAPVDQNTLTRRYTEETIGFIRKNKDQPFFIYLPQAMTHNPLHAGEAFRGKSANGIYGDAVEEIDWSVGQILQSLKETGLDDNTLVIFTSDNGAEPRFGGSNLPLSGWKGSTWEGGMRVPCIMRWPGVIPGGAVCKEMATTLEILPTIAKMVAYPLPQNLRIDGKDMFTLMTQPQSKSPREVLYYYQLEQLQAVRAGNWKLHLALDSMYTNIHAGSFGEGRGMKLFDLENDIKEEVDVSGEHPAIVKQLLTYADKARKDLGDLNVEGLHTRKAGFVDKPVPQLLKEIK